MMSEYDSVLSINIRRAMEIDEADVVTASNNLLGDPNRQLLLQRKYGIKVEGENDDQRQADQLNKTQQFVRSSMPPKYTDPYRITPTKEPKETQTEKDKRWTSEGTTMRNGKNVISLSQVSETDLPRLMKMPVTEAGKNIGAEAIMYLKNVVKEGTAKVITYSHTDVADNRPLLFVDDQGTPVTGILQAGIYDEKNPSKSKLAIAVKEKDDEGDVVKWKLIPYNPVNKDKIKNEFGKNLEEVAQELGGKTGTVKDEGTKSTRKSSGSSSQKLADATEVIKYDKSGKGWVVDIKTKKVLRAAN